MTLNTLLTNSVIRSVIFLALLSMAIHATEIFIILKTNVNEPKDNKYFCCLIVIIYLCTRLMRCLYSEQGTSLEKLLG